MKIFLDDERKTPEGWVRCYWPHQVISLLKNFDVSVVSLDHDLGDDDKGTGYDVLLWIEQAVVMEDFHPPLLMIHSANPSARERMRAAINAIARLHRNRQRQLVEIKALSIDVFRRALKQWHSGRFIIKNPRYYRKGMLVLNNKIGKGKDKESICQIRTEWAEISLSMRKYAPTDPKNLSCLTITVYFLKNENMEPVNYVFTMPKYCGLYRYRIWVDSMLTQIFNTYKVY